ncbi:N-acetylmuramoyl-L-alanine amidase [Paenibacillus sp. MWE-103]|uniref:N-acetylmuramoyl-L-alanine amidase n=1 Tax=Paenibacillus artemisiicola TaxID=1172618 RepID=A0ABS3W982_9BACL|nr:N-acetylmuramoyl-L-alanine amidase [Paenibacillus artemisiicola]MBO7744886.1 N-acetylmuramoyl-L-alanine amidase [Paenibacillus artemisiicola]
MRERFCRRRPFRTGLALLAGAALLCFCSAGTSLAAPGESWEEAPSAQSLLDSQLPTDYSRALPTAQVLIDVGHGGIDGGAHHEHILEKDINLAVAKKVYAMLQAQGIRTVLNRNGDYALSDDNRWNGRASRHRRDLSQRSQLTKEINTQILVSIHVNWAPDRTEYGPLVLHQNEGESALLAFCIQDALNRRQNTRGLPRVGKPFYLLNVVKQPAVIVEMGFISHEGDRLMLTSPDKQTELAAAIASGVRNYILLR